MNAGANWLDGDGGTVEVVFLKDVDVRLDLDVIWCIVAGGVICNGIDEIADVDRI